MSPRLLNFWTDKIWLLWSENCPLRSDNCLQRIVSVVGSTGIFSLLKRCFAIIWGKKRAGAQENTQPKSSFEKEAFFSATRFLYIKIKMLHFWPNFAIIFWTLMAPTLVLSASCCSLQLTALFRLIQFDKSKVMRASVW
jgi:hypothetical protein